METVVELLHSNIIKSFSWSLIHSLWQGLILFLIVIALLKIVRKDNAQVRYFILINGMFVFLLSVFITFSIINQSTSYDAASLEAVKQADFQFISNITSLEISYDGETSQPFLFAFILFWLVGISLLFIRFLWGLLTLNRLKKSGSKIIDRKLINRINMLIKQLKITESVNVYSSEIVSSPITFGFLKPIILIPVSLLSDLSIEQIELIITHELMHIKRRDYLINIVQNFIEILFFFNPGIWWLSNQIRKERENCCDDGVVEHFDPLMYSQTLTQVESNRIKLQQQQLYLSIANNQNQLLNRIQRIIKSKPKPNRSNLISKMIMSFLLFSSILIISWIAPKGKTVTADNINPSTVVLSEILQNEIMFFPAKQDTSVTSTQEKTIREAIAQLKLAEEQLHTMRENKLEEALAVLNEKKQVIAKAENEIQHELNAIMADSGNTLKSEMTLIKNLHALEASEMQVKRLEETIANLNSPIEHLNNNAFNSINKQMRLAELQYLQYKEHYKITGDHAKKLAKERKKLTDQKISTEQ